MVLWYAWGVKMGGSDAGGTTPVVVTLPALGAGR